MPGNNSCNCNMSATSTHQRWRIKTALGNIDLYGEEGWEALDPASSNHHHHHPPSTALEVDTPAHANSAACTYGGDKLPFETIWNTIAYKWEINYFLHYCLCVLKCYYTATALKSCFHNSSCISCC